MKKKVKAGHKSRFLLVSEDNQKRIIETLKSLIQRSNQNFLKQVLSRLHPTDIANLWDFFDPKEQDFLLSLLGVEASADLLSELGVNQRSEIFKTRNTEWIIHHLAELETDDVVDILKELPTGEANFIIRKFDEEYSKKIKTLIKYPEETAGSLMSSDFFAVNENARIDEIIEKFREFNKTEEIEHLQFIYVVDKNDHLLGYIPLRKLILEKASKKAKDIMKPAPVLITPLMDQEQVAKIFKNHKLISLPVIDEKGVLLGRITIDDIVDVLEKEASEDVFKMVGLNTEKSIANNVFHSLKSRLPWMFINLGTTALSALVISHFQTTLEKYIILAVFMPMIAALGGATGNQMVTMIVRGLAVGEIHLRQVRSFLTKEFGTVLIGSFMIAAVMSLFAHQIYEQSGLDFIFLVSGALIFNMICATTIGTAIPLVLKLFKLDPATGSSILVTTLTDIVGFYIFLGFASIFLPH